MKDITKGLYDYFIATSGSPAVNSALYIQIGGRFYKEIAVQNVSFPYVVYHIISDVNEFTFTESFENVRIQFDLVSKSVSTSEVEDMYTNLKSLFDLCLFSISNNTLITMQRVLARLQNESDYGIFVYNVDYKLLIKSDVGVSVPVLLESGGNVITE